jgi:TolB-like protein/Tfp pilus assembly protein PilF
LFIVMDLYEGETLKKKIERGPLRIEEAIEIVLQVAQGLSKAHEQGIVHRDIKPANIVLTRDGIPKILDFGLAKLSRLTMVTKPGSTVGTVAYMSPEQARGETVDQRTDIWSVGVVLYEMITGRLPFEGEFDAGIIYAILNTEPTPISSRTTEIPAQLERIVTRALAKRPEMRYQDVQELITDLRRLHTKAASPGPAGHPMRRQRVVRAAKWGIPVFIGVMAGTVYILVNGRMPPQPPVPETSLPRQMKSSIAVLPFDDLSPAKNQEYFCSGIAEEIRTSLSRIPDLKVVGGTSAAALKGKQMGIREIGRELGVATVLEGSVRKDEGHIRITLQLSDAADGFTRWSETYDREMKDVFSIQENVSRSVAAALKIAMAPETAGFIYPRQTKSAEAYEYLLKGNHFVKLYLISYRERDFQSALQMYEKAIAIDTACAVAYGGMAWAYEHHYVYGTHSAAKDYTTDRDQVVRNVQRAYQLDRNSGPINAGMAYVALKMGSYDSAYEFCRRAIELEPRSLFVNHLVGEFFAGIGLHQHATKFFGRAIELDPLYLLSLGEMASSLEWAGEFDKAADFYRRTLDLSPDDLLYKADFIRFLIKTGRVSEADMLLQPALKARPDFKSFTECRVLLLASRGAREEALKLGRSAAVCAILGAKQESLTLLEDSTNQTGRCIYLDLLHNPLYEKLRNEERFQTLLEQQRHLYEDRLTRYGGL